MDLTSHQLSEKYLNVVAEKLQDAINVNDPVITLKWGKYRLINKNRAHRYQWHGTRAQKLVGAATSKNIDTCEKLGFTFHTIYFVDMGYGERVSTIIIGKDPNGVPVALYMGLSSIFYYYDRTMQPDDMWDTFNDRFASKPIFSTEELLAAWAPYDVGRSKSWYKILPDGSVDVYRGLTIRQFTANYRYEKIEHVPFKINIVKGDLGVFNVTLVDLQNFPETVEGNMRIQACYQLTSLKGFPKSIWGNCNIAACNNINEPQLKEEWAGSAVKGDIILDCKKLDKYPLSYEWYLHLNRDNPGVPMDF